MASCDRRFQIGGLLERLDVRYLARFSPSVEPRAAFLGSVRSLAQSVGAVARNPKWTSYGALEVDIFAPSKADFDLFLAVAESLGSLEFARDLNQAPAHQSEEELFLEARSYFNSERYWECHEVLEGAWRNMRGEEKRYVQGIILVCAAFVHHQKGEEDVALSVLRRASKQLDLEARVYHGIDVHSLKLSVERTLSSGKFDVFTV